MTLKTPEQIAAQLAHRYPSAAGWHGGDGSPAGRLDREAVTGEMDGEMILGLMADAVQADRAQQATRTPATGPFTFHLIENGPDIRFYVTTEDGSDVKRNQVARTFEAWYNADDSQDSEQLHESYVTALENYAGVEFK